MERLPARDGGDVEAEAALVRDVVGRGVPLLGICFGAQVLAHALGGTVSRSPVAEIGWLELEVDAAGIAAGPWMEWHDDVFTPPEGFDVLARTAVGPQLIRGGRCLGTQFHPEATETIVRDWIESGGAAAYRTHGGDPDALLDRDTCQRGAQRRRRPARSSTGSWSTSPALRRRPHPDRGRPHVDFLRGGRGEAAPPWREHGYPVRRGGPPGGTRGLPPCGRVWEGIHEPW